MIAPARQAAYDILRAVNGARADLPNALARARTRLPDERDRALAGEIATGTLRWMAAFDHVIAQFARRPAAKLDPEVLDILRLTAFQLLHLDRVPASAAVNDAVNLTRKAGKKSAGPLVNAVLRRISRERGALPLPVPPAKGGWHLSGKGASHLSGEGARHLSGEGARHLSGEGARHLSPEREAALDYLAITLSQPRWLAGRRLDAYGFEAAEAWARFDNAPAALTLRVNTLRTTRDALTRILAERGVDVEPAPYAPDGLLVRSGNPVTLEGVDGLFVVQDEASQLVAVFAGAKPGERVLDLCASPGGKTTAMAAAMRDGGVIVACDVRDRRIALLSRAVAASGATLIRIVQADASAPLPFRAGEHAAGFDCVLLDAPCSGLGTLRRDPDIKWRRREEDLPGLAAAQVSMLRRAGAVVRAGGRLIYSTCSSEREENEDVVAQFLASHPHFSRSAPPRSAGLAGFMTAEGYFRTFPFRHRLESFFGAMLVKTKDLQ